MKLGLNLLLQARLASVGSSTRFCGIIFGFSRCCCVMNILLFKKAVGFFPGAGFGSIGITSVSLHASRLDIPLARTLTVALLLWACSVSAKIPRSRRKSE